jgi:hypothetical protein
MSVENLHPPEDRELTVGVVHTASALCSPHFLLPFTLLASSFRLDKKMMIH